MFINLSEFIEYNVSVKFQNTWPLLCISLNNKSAYCFIPHSLSIPTNVNDVTGCSEIAPIMYLPVFCLRTILDPRRTVLIGHFFYLICMTHGFPNHRLLILLLLLSSSLVVCCSGVSYMLFWLFTYRYLYCTVSIWATVNKLSSIVLPCMLLLFSRYKLRSVQPNSSRCGTFELFA